ncbi:MAG: magnesium chelatase [Gemmatimonadota bacterium]
MRRPETLGALKASGYRSESVRDELRRNLLARLRDGGVVFSGIIGYEDSVVPQIVNAILARHHFILLGLRGQAKSRLLRGLVELLDEAVPVVAGSEVNDDPLRPISKQAREIIEERGDGTPIEWLPRDARYVEKLATPDVTIADIIGDLDPIRAAHGGHLLSDELAIHFGLLPRANRGIFAINELPDLAGKIQVGLFNVMQEGDVQIKGFPVRLPLDVLLAFTANPEDYTARGKIITPLKDRIGSEIVTHYPRDLEHGVAITAQEAWLARGSDVRVPHFVRQVIEHIAVRAREDRRVDRRSGVSQRMPITVLENAFSNAERRALLLGESPATLRLVDVRAALPAITGKLELEYEGELEGGEPVARDLISLACADTFDEYFDLEDAAPVVGFFDRGGILQLADGAQEGTLLEGFRTIDGLIPLVEASGIVPEDAGPGAVVAACELVLDALTARRQITRTESGEYGGRPRPSRPGGAPGGSEPEAPGGAPGPGGGPGVGPYYA